MVSTGRIAFFVLAAPVRAFPPLRSPALVARTTQVRASSFGFGGRDPQKLAKEGQEVFEEAVTIVRDVGLQAAIRRTMRGQRALLETSLELLRELPSTSGGSPLEALQSSVQIGQQLVNGDVSGLEKYLKALPPELAPRTLRKLFERLGATYIKLVQFVYVCCRSPSGIIAPLNRSQPPRFAGPVHRVEPDTVPEGVRARVSKVPRPKPLGVLPRGATTALSVGCGSSSTSPPLHGVRNMCMRHM